MLKAAGQEAPNVKPVLEINPEHLLLARIRAAQDDEFDQWARLLLDQARWPKAPRSPTRRPSSSA